jgi:hypothetical protein
LSFNDSGRVLSELMGISGFDQKVNGLAKANLVQQGAELAYLLRHDPEFRNLRREHFIEAGKHVRLKNNVNLLADFFEKGLDPYSFQFYVIGYHHIHHLNARIPFAGHKKQGAQENPTR